MTTLLVIDDDLAITEMLVEAFEGNGYRVVVATDGAKGLEIAQSEQPDLVLLDLMLPGVNGYSVCRILRQQSDTPIIMMSGVQDEMYRIAGFELGINDFMSKPFSVNELMARVRSLLRWHPRASAEPALSPAQTRLLEADSLRVDLTRRLVWRDDDAVELTLKEFELLVYFMQHSSIVLSRAQLMDQIWPYPTSSNQRTIDVHIHSLREKVEHDPARPSLIQTVRGVGYRFQTSYATS